MISAAYRKKYVANTHLPGFGIQVFKTLIKFYAHFRNKDVEK